MASDTELIIKINGTAKGFLDEIEKVKKKTEDLSSTLSAVGKASAVAFAGFATAIALSTKAFADYETALVGVGKTTDITGTSLKNFGKEFQKLSAAIPVSTNELLGIAQAAGQLGVKGEENLLKFTDTVAKLGVATDLSGSEAATALARILNVTGENIQSIDKLGSVIVRMGNNFAASESEIVRVTTEVAKSTAVFGVTSTQAVGLATAMRAMGVQAELGGSVVGRTFQRIAAAIDAGGSSLQNLAIVTGISGDQLKKTFKDDAISVFQKFVEGLGAIQEAGGSTTKALASFGLRGDEVLKILPVLAKNSDKLGDALGTASDELTKGTALNKEAAAAFNTLNSETQLLKNNFETLKVSIGEKLAPQIRELFAGISSLLKGFSELDSETIGSIASLLKWGAAISGVVAGLTAFLFGAIQVSGIITGIGAAFLPAAAAASAFWLAVSGPIGVAVIGLTAAGVAAKLMYDKFSSDKAPQSLEEINGKLKDLRKELDANNKVLNDQSGFYDKSGAQIRLDTINDEIKKLEELRQAKLRSSKGFGTGEMLVKPKASGTLSDLIPSFGNETIPLKTDLQLANDSKAQEQSRKSQEVQTQILDEGTKNRIAAAKRENEALQLLQFEKDAGLLESDLKLRQEQAKIDEEYAQARLIKNNQERELALQNLDLKHADTLAKIQEFNLAEADLEVTRQEEKAALNEELRQLDVEQQAQFTEEDRAALQASIDSKTEAEKKYNQDRINKNIATQNQFKQDEIKYGTAIAETKKFFASEEVQGVKNTADQLVALQNSKNSQLKSIGKAAAHVQAAIATGEGAIKAYTSLAGIPLVGPALGAAAAAALIAFGVEQQQNIANAATGGFVPQVSGGSRDRVPMMLSPNELVVPEALAPNFIQAAGLPDTQSDRALGNNQNNESTILQIELNDRAGELITLNQRQGKALGLIGAS